MPKLRGHEAKVVIIAADLKHAGASGRLNAVTHSPGTTGTGGARLNYTWES